MSTLYLKDIVGMTPNGILSAKVTRIGGVEQNRNNKEFRKVDFYFPSTSKTLTEGVFEFNFRSPKGTLAGLKEGDSVEITLKEGWPNFKILKSGEQSQTNSAQVRSERVATSAVNDLDVERNIHDWKLGLAGVVQAMISRGDNDSLITGESDQNPKTAIQWAQWIRTKAHELGTQIPS